jgi:hypothetical protein
MGVEEVGVGRLLRLVLFRNAVFKPHDQAAKMEQSAAALQAQGATVKPRELSCRIVKGDKKTMEG